MTRPWRKRSPFTNQHNLIRARQADLTFAAEVIIYNVAEITQGLTIDGPALAGIYSGKITKWNDPALAALNPGLPLPDQNITAVHRSDGSGTTEIFTRFLSKVSDEWKNGPGFGS